VKLLFRQRAFAFFSSYDVYNEAEEMLFTVKGKFSWGQKFQIYDANGVEIGMIMSKLFSLRTCYEIFRGNAYEGYGQIGEIKFRPSLTKTRYDVNFNGWQVEGDLFAWEFVVKDRNNIPIATISKELFEFTDTYSVEVDDSQNLFELIAVILIADLSRDRR